MELIVLDIDHTLLEAKYIVKENLNLLTIQPDYITFDTNLEGITEDLGLVIYLRPHLIEFLDFLSKNNKYSIAIWTAGTRKWAEFITQKILKDYTFKFVWSCEDMYLHYKQIQRIFIIYPDFNMYNTLFIDDRIFISDSMILNNNCHLQIKEFFYDQINDDEFINLMNLLNKYVFPYNIIEQYKKLKLMQLIKPIDE